MEEIIASISRIIAEDKRPEGRRAGEKRPGASISAASGEKGEVLELTEAVNEDGSVRHVTPGGQGQAEAAEQTNATSDTSARAEPEPLRAEPVVEPRLEPRRERIVSSTASGAAAAAFAQLGALPRESRGGDRTLEEIVRELLRPLLQTWLDKHLPGIVERLVREEIGRVVGEAGLR
jgi:cell pole-organizing protein PopZ